MSINKIIFSFLLLTCTVFVINGQSDHPKLRGIQIGYPGVWFYKETKLFNTLYLRNEFGAEWNFENKRNFAVNRYQFYEPVITLSPRWYYNVAKRNAKGKNIDDNAANYFSINARAKINPRLLAGVKYVNNFNELSLVPTWGIRRNLNSRFNYEFMIGIGYFYSDTYDLYQGSKTSYYDYDLQLRLGYKF